MEKLEQLYEGKAKKVFKTDDPHCYIVEYKDDATALNGLKRGTIAGKGVINNRVSNHLMRMLEQNGIPTHLVEEISDRETIVKKVTIIPLEVIVRNIAAGSLSKRLGLPEGTPLAHTVLEYCYKDDALGRSARQRLPHLCDGHRDAGGTEHDRGLCLPGERAASRILERPEHRPHRL